jgi:acyl-CoA reductase-like NAD-dependent aldehyde dehydrogenase
LQPRGPWAGTQPEDRLTSQQGRSRHDEDTERAPILSSRRPDTCGTLFRTVASHTNSEYGRTDLSTILTLDDELVLRQRGGQHPARIEVLDPFTEEVVATVPAGTVNDAESAVFAARRAFDGWSARTVAERAQMLRGVVRELRQRRHELVELMIEELGSPRSAAETVQVDTPIAVLEMICDLAQRIELETRDANVVVLREPIGVVGCITPWNYPLHQVIVKIGSALVMGCTVVLKASELTPLSLNPWSRWAGDTEAGAVRG